MSPALRLSTALRQPPDACVPLVAGAVLPRQVVTVKRSVTKRYFGAYPLMRQETYVRPCTLAARRPIPDTSGATDPAWISGACIRS